MRLHRGRLHPVPDWRKLGRGSGSHCLPHRVRRWVLARMFLLVAYAFPNPALLLEFAFVPCLGKQLDVALGLAAIVLRDKVVDSDKRPGGTDNKDHLDKTCGLFPRYPALSSYSYLRDSGG